MKPATQGFPFHSHCRYAPKPNHPLLQALSRSCADTELEIIIRIDLLLVFQVVSLHFYSDFSA